MAKDEDSQQVGSLEGRYANAFQIGHNAFEFLLDFGQVALESEETHFHTRIVTGPAYAKALSKLLGASINQYEQTFGKIQEG